MFLINEKLIFIMVKLTSRADHPMYFGTTPQVIDRANQLRNFMTMPERELWKHIRKRKIKGFKFRRQHPIKNMIVDFFCFEAKLAIEVDGGIHQCHYQAERDKERTIILNNLGIKELRFSNKEIYTNIDLVIQRIEEILLL